MKKNEKTVNQNQGVEDTTNYAPIYLVLNGNNVIVNNYYLRTAIAEAHEYGQPLYVTANAGKPQDPNPCPPAFPNCHG